MLAPRNRHWRTQYRHFPKWVEVVLVLLVTVAVVAAVAVHRLHLLEAGVLLHRLVPARVQAKGPRQIETSPVVAIDVAR